MRQALSRQTGFSFLAAMVLIAVFGFGTVIGFRLFPIYFNAFTVQKILEDVAVEAQDKQWTRLQIWDKIKKRIDINDIDFVKKENFQFTREKGMTTIAFDYEIRTKLVGNLDAVAHFMPSQTFES